jgi:glycerol 3-phosphatase-2
MRALDFDAWLLDLDGVVYVGDRLLPGVAEALATLRAAGKHLRFLTNDPRPTREQLAERLRRLGIDVAVEELVTCGWATARLLPQLGIGSAYVVGSVGLAEELARVGITVVDDGIPDAVVLGADERLDFRRVVKGVFWSNAALVSSRPMPMRPTRCLSERCQPPEQSSVPSVSRPDSARSSSANRSR